MTSKPETKRCAIYTRKSTEAGLEQEFNSLDAQREAGEAYIASQRHQGWKVIRTAYDDGGFSGGNLDRPGLEELLKDIERGAVDIVVVYKVDRLSRSIGDFARLIDSFEEHDVAFVSVTQEFNTTTSMGRLMLNVLLSFAQFEREVTGERIRDKIYASRKKGMWMGGVPPIGYDLVDKKLVVNETEAKTLRFIFRTYLEVRSIPALRFRLGTEGYTTKDWVSASGRKWGGKPFSRGHLYRILNSRTFLGDAVHKDECFPGEHKAIVDQDLWDNVQAALQEHRHRTETDANIGSGALLKGLLFDDAGSPMSPTHTKKGSRRYRYYVSQAVLQCRPDDAGSVTRVPAHDVEKLVQEQVLKFVRAQQRDAPWRSPSEPPLDDIGAVMKRFLDRVTVTAGELVLKLVSEEENDTEDGDRPMVTICRMPFQVGPGASITTVLESDEELQDDPRSHRALIRAVALGHKWREMVVNGEVTSMSEIAERYAVTSRYVRRLLRFRFLAPDIIDTIINSENPRTGLFDEIHDNQPLCWRDQRLMLVLSDFKSVAILRRAAAS